ncbi:hypothetical protein CVT25_000176 [Psilocybe cyanescens]|uniref:Carbohydrate esterase family 16 protein n=1 Tax=Psilocybe cyanescens TaxID=93625 RepID=A0A409XQ92_PSICY|nr:hypothetical protein CVT25_000176 [Psilocybe cyanescens]
MSLSSVSLTALFALLPSVSAHGANFWFSFGDSYTQTDFNATGPLPSVANPIGNPPFPGGTATPGPNWVGYVTETYNQSLLFTYNYAFSGATIDANLVLPFSPIVQTLTDQVNTFLATVSNKPATTPWTSKNALFSIWIGINDIDLTFQNGQDHSAFTDTLLNAYFALVNKLVDVGARNFLFVNVPPTDRSPKTIALGASAQTLNKDFVDTYNAKLAAKVNAFRLSKNGVKTFMWDSHQQFTTILNHPTVFGFQDATSIGSTPNFFWG